METLQKGTYMKSKYFRKEVCEGWKTHHLVCKRRMWPLGPKVITVSYDKDWADTYVKWMNGEGFE